MKQAARSVLAMAIALAAAGCAPVALAPGADQVKVTSNLADVATCTPLGTVQSSKYSPDSAMLSSDDALRRLKNQTVGLGGNVVMLTMDVDQRKDMPPTGVAYRCDSGASPAR